jgi:universal stress protein E
MKGFKDILCVVDLEKEATHALERAVALAENNQARLTVASMVMVDKSSINKAQENSAPIALKTSIIKRQNQALEHLVQPYRKLARIETKVLAGRSVLEIVREVLRNKHDLMIKISDKPNLLYHLVGSDDMRLLRKCPCPVWLMKAQSPKKYHRILAAVDVDDAYPLREVETRQALNHQIVELASSIALAEFAELHIVYAWQVISERTMRRGTSMEMPEQEVNAHIEEVHGRYDANLEALLEEVASTHSQTALDYLKPERHSRKGWANQEVPALAKEIGADLVVMGTVARTGVPGFILGNTAETILNRLECSVVAIKPPGFVSSVKPKKGRN